MPNIKNYYDLVSFSKKIIKLAAKDNLELRIFGSVGVSILCNPSNNVLEWKDLSIRDIDFIAKIEQIEDIDKLLSNIKFVLMETQFSTNGEHRIYIGASSNYGSDIKIDIFFGNLTFNHRIPKPYFDTNFKYTLPPTQLLLSKLSIVKIVEKDVKDIIYLLAFHKYGDDYIDEDMLKRVWCSNTKAWGLCRTCIKSIKTVKNYLNENENHYSSVKVVVEDRLEYLLNIIRHSNKSLSWKIRACIGEKVSYYKQA